MGVNKDEPFCWCFHWAFLEVPDVCFAASPGGSSGTDAGRDRPPKAALGPIWESPSRKHFEKLMLE